MDSWGLRLLNTHLEKQIETDTGSPVLKEKTRVKKALADVERVVAGFLEIAASDKIQIDSQLFARDIID
jgi:hypothetical protein